MEPVARDPRIPGHRGTWPRYITPGWDLDMSAEIRVRGERRVRADGLEEFKKAAAEAMQRHRELDGPGTLSFDTFLDESRGLWVALEHYVDSQAMLDHLAVRDPELTRRISQVSDIGHSEVFGTPSAELATLLSTMGDGVIIYPLLDSLGTRDQPSRGPGTVGRTRAE
jgi:quinol monooxygenase YgiN